MVEDLFTQFRRVVGDARRQSKIGKQILQELQTHSMIEEMHLYPMVRDTLEDAAGVIDHSLDEHNKVDETIMRLLNMAPEEEGFEQTMNQLMSDVQEHVQEEESQLFPMMRERMAREDIMELGKMLQQEKRARRLARAA